MTRFMTSLFAVVALFGSAVFADAADEKPKLNFTQDGDDLVVSTTFTVNAGPHVLWTHVSDLGRDAYLNYYVIQNRDRLFRSYKQIEVKWRLIGRKQGEQNYHVEKSFLPSSAELKELLPQLQKLMEERESFRKKPKP